jgi:hypothetical protein
MATETKTEMSEEMAKVAEEANSIIAYLTAHWNRRRLTHDVNHTLTWILANTDNLNNFKEKDLVAIFTSSLATLRDKHKTELCLWRTRCATEHQAPRRRRPRPTILYNLNRIQEHACFSLYLQGFLRGKSKDIIDAECDEFMRLEAEDEAEE